MIPIQGTVIEWVFDKTGNVGQVWRKVYKPGCNFLPDVAELTFETAVKPPVNWRVNRHAQCRSDR